MSNFPVYIERVLSAEGGFSKDENDPGNWTGGFLGRGELKGTNWGISAASYPTLDIENLTREEAIEIYKKDFWLPVHGDTLPPAVAFSALDGAVNSGISRSIMWLQEAANVVDDGKWGPVTIAAMSKADPADLLLRYNGKRLVFMTKCKTWNLYGRGWAARIAQNLLYAAQDN